MNGRRHKGLVTPPAVTEDNAESGEIERGRCAKMLDVFAAELGQSTVDSRQSSVSVGSLSRQFQSRVEGSNPRVPCCPCCPWFVLSVARIVRGRVVRGSYCP